MPTDNGDRPHDDDAHVIRRSTPFEGWSTSRPKRSRRFRRFSGLLLIPLLVASLGAPAVNVPPAHADELADAKAKQAALVKQIKDQKAAIALINGMQTDLSHQIASTKKELAGINADLVAVRKSINQMVVRIEAVKKEYFALVARLQLLDNQLSNVVKEELARRSELGTKKAELADRIREAYDTDRTTLLETFLSGGSFTDVVSEVSYINDFAEHDKVLAEEIVDAQAALATIHATVEATRGQTETLRGETLAQKAGARQAARRAEGRAGAPQGAREGDRQGARDPAPGLRQADPEQEGPRQGDRDDRRRRRARSPRRSRTSSPSRSSSATSRRSSTGRCPGR